MRAKGTRYAVGLYRVSTAEQGQSGLGLEAQQASVRAFVASQGWTLVSEHSDIASGKDDRRPGFQGGLLKCRQLGAVLVAARLDRITRRAHTLSQLLEDGVSIDVHVQRLAPAEAAGLLLIRADLGDVRFVLAVPRFPRCLIPVFDGAVFSQEWRDALLVEWAGVVQVLLRNVVSIRWLSPPRDD
ncbi:recombinase family protein [Roseococcus sp.]|uniref:recombinase family protein n=1 Tax=Roseococcus sp. TaxID=2109646 RepID=UPI003BADA5F9